MQNKTLQLFASSIGEMWNYCPIGLTNRFTWYEHPYRQTNHKDKIINVIKICYKNNFSKNLTLNVEI